MLKQGLLAVSLAAALAGCAAPLVRPNALAMQTKSEHAHDWQGLAQRAVLKLPSTVHDTRPAVFVESAPEESEFNTAYRRFVEQALYEANYPVLTTPRGAQIIIRTSVQPFLYDHGHEKSLFSYASFYTTAAAAGGQLRHISSTDTGFFAGLVAGPILDVLIGMNATTKAEVVVSTTISEGGNYHYLGSETMYVQPSDLVLFVPPPQPRDAPVVMLPVVNGR
jgi:hypothetical protein